MTPHNTLPTLAVSLIALAFVAWIATSHSGEQGLYAPASQAAAHSLSRPPMVGPLGHLDASPRFRAPSAGSYLGLGVEAPALRWRSPA